MVGWADQLEALDSLLWELRQSPQAQNSVLRFDRSFVIASDIAEQFYCEKKS